MPERRPPSSSAPQSQSSSPDATDRIQSAARRRERLCTLRLPQRRYHRVFSTRNAIIAAVASIAALPLPAYAARLAIGEWGTFFFFAVVASVVIVLLLYEVVEEDVNREQPPDRRRATKRQHMHKPGRVTSR